MELVLIPEGSFQMGSGNKLFSEAPIHTAKIERPFYLGKLPVTQAQWMSVCGRNPSAFVGEDRPVDNVSWREAVQFCNVLSKKIRRGVRLPSEVEWECACRAGSTGEFFFSSEGPFLDDSTVPARIRRALKDYAWFDENSKEVTHPVGLKQPNPFGLHDMIGNVWEWCADHWHEDYAGAPTDGTAWLNDRPHRPLRCLRGSSWDMNAFRCRSCYRSWDWEDLAINRFGFRIAVDAS